MKMIQQALKDCVLTSTSNGARNDPRERYGYIDEFALENETKNMGIYKTKVSDSSCFFKDIVGFTYGAVTSRFWLLRKHFNQMTQNQFSKLEISNNLPF